MNKVQQGNNAIGTKCNTKRVQTKNATQKSAK